MQKRIGIRLRHLEGPFEQRPQHMLNTQQPLIDQNRKRQRSPSPLGRKKIFPKPNQEQRYQEQPQTYNKKQHADNGRPSTTMTSPIMNQPFNSHNVSMNEGNEYESEVERLIDSLKKKSLELQRKDDVIVRLSKQIQLLRAENGAYQQQIKTLKAQLEYEKSSHSSTQRTQIYETRNVNQNAFQSKQKDNYGSPFQQYQTQSEKSPVVHVKINPSKAEQWKQKDAKPNYRQMEDKSKEQDSILSDYLSPLMVLSSEPAAKPPAPIYTQIADKKSNFKSESNGVSRIVRQEVYPNKNNFQSTVESPFNRKFNHGEPDKYLYESAGNFGNADQRGQREFERQFQRQRENRRWPTLESSAAHFNTRVPDVNPQANSPWKSNRELAIEDSKQFRFEDFDFSDLDNSMANSQF